MSVSLFLSVAVMTARKEAQRTKKHDRSQGLYNRIRVVPAVLQHRWRPSQPHFMGAAAIGKINFLYWQYREK
ncbi:hypothetical protein [Janthinobacterium sp. PSPC2-1]|uniref:hypothetical protein n=1 Tax=unclassified Janthinobacterium TaxID=2610881 RepID=UPI003CF859F4